MPIDKDRLYIALYARGGAPTMINKEDMYHWALLTGPKTENEKAKGTRFHVKGRLVASGQRQWFYDELPVSLHATNMLLVRVKIGKIIDTKRLRKILRDCPIRQGEQDWNCVSWVKEALEALWSNEKVLGTAITDWDEVRASSMNFCQKKIDQHRFDGKANFDMKMPPTLCLLEGKELIP
ncbi:hypothetical protein GcM1_214018 [Golovinomyces cichoracearum]|uniref:Uncharacterized protein n=1 Tax=Golovinomyces cichoracearum TaxID=62708 RepID=A0A420IU50_9PEZI|nr:hypothetical protein GcM1_214018 [Golovinomyces cichoracearum]